jgi:hypothetical protein
VILAASENEIIDFLTDCHVQGRSFDISRIADLDTLAHGQRDAIATKLK